MDAVRDPICPTNQDVIRDFCLAYSLPVKRLSLTRSQTAAGAGAELLSLCQTVTQDGSISQQEATELAAWLAANKSSDLPSIAFLCDTIAQILADGKVTHDEQKALYLAVEAVLPPE